MKLSFSESYFHIMKGYKNPEVLFGVRANDQAICALGVLYQKDDGHWIAHSYEPPTEVTVETRDEAASYLTVVALSNAGDFLFLTSK